jgi:lycopene cyclase domain-containing protein
MTYAVLALVFVGVAALTALAAATTVGLSRRWWLTTAAVALVLLVLTAAFDSLMIALDLFRYHDSALAGPRVALVPIEDYAWPVAAAVGLPALWELVGSRRGAGAAGADGDRRDAAERYRSDVT